MKEKDLPIDLKRKADNKLAAGIFQKANDIRVEEIKTFPDTGRRSFDRSGEIPGRGKYDRRLFCHCIGHARMAADPWRTDRLCGDLS